MQELTCARAVCAAVEGSKADAVLANLNRDRTARLLTSNTGSVSQQDMDRTEAAAESAKA